MEDISSSLSKLLPQGFFETADRGPRASSKDVYHAVKEVFSPFGGSSTIPLVHKPEQAKVSFPLSEEEVLFLSSIPILSKQ